MVCTTSGFAGVSFGSSNMLIYSGSAVGTTVMVGTGTVDSLTLKGLESGGRDMGLVGWVVHVWSSGLKGVDRLSEQDGVADSFLSGVVKNGP